MPQPNRKNKLKVNTKRPPTPKKPVKSKLKDPLPDTSRCSQAEPLKYRDNLKVEETLEKNKEVKESDIFEGLPPKSKKNGSQSKK
jgi:hypothetical protein